MSYIPETAARGMSIRIGLIEGRYIVEYSCCGGEDYHDFATHAEALAKAADLFGKGGVATVHDLVEAAAGERQAEEHRLRGVMRQVLDRAEVEYTKAMDDAVRQCAAHIEVAA